MNHDYALHLNPSTIHLYFFLTRYQRLCKTEKKILYFLYETRLFPEWS